MSRLALAAIFCLFIGSTAFAQVAPTITSQPGNVDSNVNGVGFFSVQADGTAPLTYQWRKDGVDIPGAVNPIYIRYNLQESDAGYYTVVVSNVAGSVVSDPGLLIVSVPPVITQQPQSVATNLGQTVSFTIVASGNEPVCYQWSFYTGGGGSSHGQSSGWDQPTLTISDVQAGDAGSYQCTLFYSGGRAFVYSARVNLTIAPEITAITPQFVQVTNGVPDGPFTLTVDGTGFLASGGSGSNTGSQVRWNGNPRPTTYVSGSTLTAAIPASDIAGFTGIATAVITVLNPATGEISNAAALTITPSSVVAAQSDVATTNSSATVSTAPSMAGNAGVTATLQNNTDGTGAATITVANYDPVTYLPPIPPPAPAFDVGVYMDVQAINVDSTDTATAVFYYPTTVTDEGSLTLQYYDGTNWVDVKSSGGADPFKVMGGINSNNIVAGGSFTVVFDDTSTPKLTELTGTVFTFGLAPAGGKEDKHKPKILTDPADQTVTVGADATFSVTVKPDLPVTYQWHCDGKKGPVIAGATQATLVLHNVTMADADKYVVVVTNRNGSTTSKKATLTVLPQAPVIVAAPQSQAVSSGDNVTFTVMATSEISPDYQWYFKSKKIGHAKSASLTLSKVELSDAGDYSVVVSNDGGEVTSAAATLTVLAPAITSINPATVNAGSSAFTLTVMGANFVNGAVVRWNGDNCPTIFVGSTTLTASIPAKDIPAKKKNGKAETVPITVKSPSGECSNAQALTIAP